MDKETARQKVQAGEVQIHFDDALKRKLLRYITGRKHMGCYLYYTNNDFKDDEFANLPIVKISEITEEKKEVIWKREDMQRRENGNNWKDCAESSDIEYRLKPTGLKEKQSIEVDNEVIDLKDYEYYSPLSCKWIDLNISTIKIIRKKQKPDFSKEIKTLKKKARKAGMKAVISFEKL